MCVIPSGGLRRSEGAAMLLAAAAAVHNDPAAASAARGSHSSISSSSSSSELSVRAEVKAGSGLVEIWGQTATPRGMGEEGAATVLREAARVAVTCAMLHYEGQSVSQSVSQSVADCWPTLLPTPSFPLQAQRQAHASFGWRLRKQMSHSGFVSFLWLAQVWCAACRPQHHHHLLQARLPVASAPLWM
jgi:hypothetical protein